MARKSGGNAVDTQDGRIGKTGAVKGGLAGSKGRQFDFMPGSESYPNGGVKARDVTNVGVGDNMSKGAKFDHLPTDPSGTTRT